MANDYKPENTGAFDRMMTFFGTCETEQELKAATVLYLFDMSYPRPDLLMAERLTRKAKGWR